MGGQRRKVANLLGLAVLGTVMSRPMHPYEIASVMRARGKDRDMPIKWGSLYRVVQNLEKYGFLRAAQSERAGGRPERTVYEITEEGRAELVQWVRDLIAYPGPHFKAGLSLLGVLPPDEAARLLSDRVRVLTELIAADRAALDAEVDKVPRLFLIEDEYELTVRAAELEWTRALFTGITQGTMPGLEQWRQFHRSGQVPAELVDLEERGTDPA